MVERNLAKVDVSGSNPLFRSSPLSSAVEHLVYTEIVGGSIPSAGIPTTRWVFYYPPFVMAHRLMSDRDHLVALTTAADLLLRNGSTCPQQELIALQARLVAAVERAKQDLEPRG